MEENEDIKVMHFDKESIESASKDFDLLCEGMRNIFKATCPSELYEEKKFEEKIYNLLSLSKKEKAIHMIFFIDTLFTDDNATTLQLFEYILDGEVQKNIEKHTNINFVS